MGIPSEYQSKKSELKVQKRYSSRGKRRLIQCLVGCFLIIIVIRLKPFLEPLKKIHIDFGGVKIHASSFLKDAAHKKDHKKQTLLTIDNEKEARLLGKVAQTYYRVKKREEKVNKKAFTLKILEKMLDKKMEQLRKIQQDIKKTLELVDEDNIKKVTHLIKILESMKPKNAAAIFDQLPTSETRRLAMRMNDKKLSLIFMNMNVDKAKALTLSLIQHKNPYAKNHDHKEE